MIPSKAYIIRITNQLSKEYADIAAKSCDDIGLPYEFIEGYENLTTEEVWKLEGYNFKAGSNIRILSSNKASCCSASHIKIWKLIAERKECAIILEHDSLMLHKVTIEIPDNKIVTLGYKLINPNRYNHKAAGQPKQITDVRGHEGAHAYAVTWKTCKLLIEELNEKGPRGPIDNIYFLKMRKTNIKLAIMDPTPAIGWIRKSTIWSQPSENNYEFIF